MKLPRFTIIEWLILIAAIAFLAICFASCGSRGLLPAGGSSGVHGGPADIVGRVAVIVSGMASLALVACGIGFVLIPNKLAVAKFALVGLAALLAAGLLYWLAQHWAIAVGLAGAVLVAGLVGYAWLHRKDIEKRLQADLDRDGRIG